MCGIAGAVLSRRDPDAAVRSAVNALLHRGPDGQGIYNDPRGHTALGHCRLSILDLSPAAGQPMRSASGRFSLVHNGEVYNFRDVREALLREGSRFVTDSDTEVILAAWEHWGTSCIRKLRGMFAFAIWDEQEQELFLVRDRLGIKPLYYTSSEEGFLFSSEVRALLDSGLVERIVDRHAVWDYLGYGSVLEPRTILRDVKAVPPGHLVRVRKGIAQFEQYWDLAVATASARSGPAPEYTGAASELRAYLETATRYHLISDVPLGAFLSGGIDSTAVVALASQIATKPIRTFCVGYGGEHGALDELKWARLAAERFGCDHTEVVLTNEDVDDLLDCAATALDQPSVDGTNTFVVARAARSDLTVALSGLGGDEVFGGYPHFARFAKAARYTPRGSPVLRRLVDDRVIAGLPGRMRLPLQEFANSPAERLAAVRLLASERVRRAALAPDFLHGFRPAADADRASGLIRGDLDAIAQMSYVELNAYLRNTLLRDADVMSMAHGLEVRPVLLDHEVVEYAFSLPAGYKNDGRRSKRIFVDAMRDLLPREITDRPKMGFEMPLGTWLRGPLRERASVLVHSPTANALLSPAFRARLRTQLNGGHGNAHMMWGVVILLAFIENHNLALDA